MSGVNLTNTSITLQSYFIDPIVLNTIRVLNLCVLAEIIGLFGIAANIINIHIFRNLGYQDGVNVTLTALAVSDLGALVFQQLYNVLVMPLIHEFDLIMSKTELEVHLHYVIGYFIRVSGLITSFASFERCLCVVLPLKVKSLITSRLTVVVNMTIFVVLSLYLFPPYYSVYMEWTFLRAYNKSILYTKYRSHGEEVLKISYNITDLVLPYTTFLILLVCSSTIYVKIKSKTKWRYSVSSVGLRNSSSASVKEVKSVVMLMTVSFLCVTLLLPDAALFTAIGFVRELKLNGALFDITNLAISFTTLFGTINCSITALIYYNMSSKYRVEFEKLMAKFQWQLVLGKFRLE